MIAQRNHGVQGAKAGRTLAKPDLCPPFDRVISYECADFLKVICKVYVGFIIGACLWVRTSQQSARCTFSGANLHECHRGEGGLNTGNKNGNKNKNRNIALTPK